MAIALAATPVMYHAAMFGRYPDGRISRFYQISPRDYRNNPVRYLTMTSVAIVVFSSVTVVFLFVSALHSIHS